MTTSIHARIQSLALSRCVFLPAALRFIVDRQIRAMIDPKITALPYVFQTALGSCGGGIKEELLDELALANLYGWIAYDIYDDILDGEGESRTFPAANYFLRELCDVYESIESRVFGTRAALKDFLDETDGANVWEQENCRVTVENGTMRIPETLPVMDCGTLLSERSIGHAVPALVLCASVGCAFDSREAEVVTKFFRHYLVARQLHDDAHDWWDDCKRGQINSIGAMILRAWREKRHADVVEFARDERPMKFFFWQNIVENVVTAIRDHIDSTRHALASASVIENPAPLETLLFELSLAADRVLAKRAAVEGFVAGRKGLANSQ